jgi:predicted kinase
VKTAPLSGTQSTKTCWINLAQQTEQRLTRGSLHFIAQNLQIKRLIPIDGNRSLPALPL